MAVGLPFSKFIEALTPGRNPSAPEWQSLRSSFLSRMKYDPGTKTLDVELVGGRNYTFSGVPADVAEGLASAGSPGQYFHAHLKGQYR